MLSLTFLFPLVVRIYDLCGNWLVGNAYIFGHKVIAAVQYCCFVAPAGLTVQIFYSVAF